MEQIIKQLIEQNEIIQAVNDIFITMDRFDWDAFLNCFADEVEDDYTSIFDIEINKVKIDDMIERWKYLKEFTSMYHSLSNHKVKIYNDEAECYSYVYSLHFLPNDIGGEDVWKVIGFYEHHLIKTDKGWKIDKMKCTAVSVTGVEVLKKLGVYDKLQEKWK